MLVIGNNSFWGAATTYQGLPFNKANIYKGSVLVQHSIPNTIVTINYNNPLLSRTFYWTLGNNTSGIKAFYSSFPQSFEAEQVSVEMGIQDNSGFYMITHPASATQICRNEENVLTTNFQTWDVMGLWALAGNTTLAPDHAATSFKIYAGIEAFYLEGPLFPTGAYFEKMPLLWNGGQPDINAGYGYGVFTDPFGRKAIDFCETAIVNESGIWHLRTDQQSFTVARAPEDYFPFSWWAGSTGFTPTTLIPYDITLEQ